MVKIVKKRVNSNLRRLCGFCRKCCSFPGKQLATQPLNQVFLPERHAPAGLSGSHLAVNESKVTSVAGNQSWLHPWRWIFAAWVLAGSAFVWARSAGNGRVPWDSLRFFLAALAAFGFLAASLIAASQTIRRLAVSMLIVLHFAAVLTAVISAPPGPWIVGQTEHWLFRPYISFMYLPNAYRFYSPEPGPASQLWCRVEYEIEEPSGRKTTLSRWVKVPDMDDEGHGKYLMSQQYTRRLSLTENVARTAVVSMMAYNNKGEPVIPEFIKRRDRHTPMPIFAKLGDIPVANENSLQVPMHPNAAVNYQRPTSEARQLLSSYARHLLHQPHPDHPSAKPVSVKIYRVQHQILPAVALAMGADPRDWINYFPYYEGEYDTKGQLLDPEDPFLYWLLPMMRENSGDPHSRLKCYVFLHAGETDWIRERP
jgi:hypothetical protein